MSHPGAKTPDPHIESTEKVKTQEEQEQPLEEVGKSIPTFDKQPEMSSKGEEEPKSKETVAKPEKSSKPSEK